MHPVVIGIAGGSGSGKSTVLRRIVEAFGPARIAMLDHDSYYRDLSHLPLEVRMGFNFDHPDALETELMVDHLDALLRGEAVQKPTYDFVNHSRAAPTVEIRPALGDHRRRHPRARRGRARASGWTSRSSSTPTTTSGSCGASGATSRSAAARIHVGARPVLATVRPMHLEFVEPSKRRADVILPRGGHNRVGHRDATRAHSPAPRRRRAVRKGRGCARRHCGGDRRVTMQAEGVKVRAPGNLSGERG